MNGHTSLKTLLLAGTFALTPSIYAQAPSSSAATTAAESPNAEFVQKAGQGGLAEVELSKLAADSAKSPAVRSFAQQMVQDHSENNKQLAAIAAHENIDVPKQMDSEHQSLRDKLASEDGKDFDRDYVAAMRADHQKMIDLLKSSQATVNSEELRTFVKKTLPVVENHLSMANGLKSE